MFHVESVRYKRVDENYFWKLIIYFFEKVLHTVNEVQQVDSVPSYFQLKEGGWFLGSRDPQSVRPKKS